MKKVNMREAIFKEIMTNENTEWKEKIFMLIHTYIHDSEHAKR